MHNLGVLFQCFQVKIMKKKEKKKRNKITEKATIISYPELENLTLYENCRLLSNVYAVIVTL